MQTGKCKQCNDILSINPFNQLNLLQQFIKWQPKNIVIDYFYRY